MEDLIQKLLVFRQENNLTNKELAKKIGVKENDIICWEKKLSFPDDEEIALITKFFAYQNIRKKDNALSDSTVTYGQILKNSREELNLTKEEFAGVFNTTVDRLTMWEEDIIEPDEEEESLINSYLEAEIFKKEHNENKSKKSATLNYFKNYPSDYEIIGEKCKGVARYVWFAVVSLLVGMLLVCCGILIFGTRFEMIFSGVVLCFFGLGLLIFGIHLVKLPKCLIGVNNYAVILNDRCAEIKFADIDTILSRRAHTRYGSYDYGEVVIITKTGEAFIQGYIENVEKVVSTLNKKLKKV